MFGVLPALNAQTPQKINYQAVARNSNTGVELANQSVFVVVKILEDSPNGEIIYQEQHPQVQTNSFGLFTLAIGGGEPVSGQFQNIPWQNGAFWLDIDLDAGNGLQNLGTMQFVSVPYALHAETVTQVNDADADPQNEMIQDFVFDDESSQLSITQQGVIFSQNLSGLIDDADADPENELVQDLFFNPVNNILSLTQAGSVLTQDLSPLINDADADPENELVQDLSFNPVSHTLSLTQAGSVLSQNLSSLINDADADPQNELVDSLVWDSTNFILSLYQPGSVFSRDLSGLLDDADSDPTNEAITNVQLSGTNLIINESENWTVSLSQLVDDADADSTNELISGVYLTNDSLLTITEGGEVTNVDVYGLKKDQNWVRSDDGANVTNIGQRVGIGPGQPQTTFSVNGSVSYGVKVVPNNVVFTVNYTVAPEDHIIICKMVMPLGGAINIIMPDPAGCEGREIIVRKTGYGPIYPVMTVDFGASPVDYLNTNHQYSEGKVSATYISLGTDGWTRIYKD